MKRITNIRQSLILTSTQSKNSNLKAIVHEKWNINENKNEASNLIGYYKVKFYEWNFINSIISFDIEKRCTWNEDPNKEDLENILVKCTSARLIHFSSENSRARQLRASRDDLRANEKERERGKRIELYENNKISPIIIQARASLFDLSDPLRRANRYFALRYPTVQDFDSRHLTRSFCRSKRATYHKVPFSRRRTNEFLMLILLEYFNNWYRTKVPENSHIPSW